jgi:hypothetical protein
LSRWTNKIEDRIFDNTGNLVSFCNDAACDAKAVEYLYGATLEPICMAGRVCQQCTMAWKESMFGCVAVARDQSFASSILRLSPQKEVARNVCGRFKPGVDNQVLLAKKAA